MSCRGLPGLRTIVSPFGFKRILLVALLAATALYLCIGKLAGDVLALRRPSYPPRVQFGPRLVSSSELRSGRNVLRSSKPRAEFMVLVREKQLQDLLASLRDLQWAFNDDLEHGYDYVILSETSFTPYFQDKINAFLAKRPSKPKATFGLVPKEHWDVPAHIDLEKAKERWERLKSGGRIPYAGSKTYRQMCRYMSGPIFQHPLLADLDYYWRIEPSTKHLCTYTSFWKEEAEGGLHTWVERDPFRYMRDNKKKYAWTILMTEFRGTVRTLMVHINAWRKENPFMLAKDNAFSFVSDDGLGYNMCHFWSNFEIIDLSFTRSPEYTSLFEALDKAGGFFYERWGDAPVRSIAAAMLLNRSEIWQVEQAGYAHAPFSYCPREEDPGQTCACDADMNVDYHDVFVECKAKLDRIDGFDTKAYIKSVNEKNGYFNTTFKDKQIGHIIQPLRLAEQGGG